MRRARLIGIALTVPAVVGVTPVSPATAVNCPPASIGGAPIGTITVGDVSVPIKPVRFISGGTLQPPATNQAVGLSTVNAPLDATEGTTVMAWHVRYGRGCPGTLNSLLDLPIGGTFTVQEHGSPPVEYRITRRLEVPKGKYRTAWFTQVGPRRLALFTCGDLRDERFHSTIATFAEPTSQP